MMIRKTLTILAASCMMYSCETKTESNPFFTEFQTEYGVPSFDKIKLEHYEPAFLKGIEEQNQNIQAIIASPEVPTFDNTIVALDNSAPILDRVSAIFFNMTDAETTDELTELSIKMAPVLSEHEDNISLNQELFKRVNAVYQQKDSMNLTTEQQRLLDKTYKGFVRSGANLDAEKQARLREINKELSTLGITFSNNVLNENNAFQLFVDKKEDLAGLPEWFCQSAAEEAKAAGQPGKWLFTLHNASRLPFLQYSENRPLREKMYKAYINRGNNNDKNDNKETIRKIVSLRLEKANLLGFNNYANFVLDETMAKNDGNVMSLLNNLWSYALPKAKAEAAELQQLMDKARMANGIHRKVKIQPNDLIVFSSNPIPGNEKAVSKIINDLYRQSADVIFQDAHVSGHACQEEIKLIYSLLHPKYAIPVHGEYRHLTAQKHVAEDLGIPKENIFILASGNVLEVDEYSAEVTGSVQTGAILVDGLGVGDVGNIVLRDRQNLAQNGIIIVVLTLEKYSNQLLAGPDIVSRGFVYVRESEDLMEEAQRIVDEAVQGCLEKHVSDWGKIKNIIRDSLSDFLWKKMKRNPMILPIIMEV